MPVTLAQPPLLQTLEKLACAADSQVAAGQLERLFNIAAPGQQWPDEWLGKQPGQASLHAGTLDIALHTLQQTASRFPDLRTTAEQVALQWDYCAVLEEQKFYDLWLQSSGLNKTPAGDVPLKWAGFRQWGFFTPDPPERFVPLLLDEIRIAPSAYHLFLHRIYRKQCFPHPETGLLAREEATPDANQRREQVSSVPAPAEPSTPYPFVWQPLCPVEQNKSVAALPAKPATSPPVAAQQAAAPAQATQTMSSPPVRRVDTPRPPARPRHAAPRATASVPAVTAEPVAAVPAGERPVVPIVIVSPSEPPLPTQGEQGARGNVGDVPRQQAAAAPKKAVRAQAGLPPTVAEELPAVVAVSATGDIPVYVEPPLDDGLQSHSTTGMVDSRQGKPKLRLAGSFADSVSLKDGSNTVSVSASWSPKPDWFISGNASFKDGEPGYAWSAGYADHKPGGWSAQINNWGPLKPGDGLGLDKAVVNIGHKVKSTTLKRNKLAASTNLSIPVKGKPSLSGTLQWNPTPHWYARTTASVPLEGGNPNWNYVVGYSNPKKLGKWKVEYSNYGTNAFPGDNLKDGSVTVSRGWQF
ncbi:MAG: hypothetical protein JG718_03215 [Candidatus Thiothrix moscowensis]|nr:hypothetical protein [Candidatus Thiothrix moscowensis]